jgi:3-deoxy-7-phosphoheptulonate synthase
MHTVSDVTFAHDQGPNYDETHVNQVTEQLEKAGLPASIMIDCSHDNSRKNHLNQPVVAQSIVRRHAPSSILS